MGLGMGIYKSGHGVETVIEIGKKRERNKMDWDGPNQNSGIQSSSSSNSGMAGTQLLELFPASPQESGMKSNILS